MNQPKRYKTSTITVKYLTRKSESSIGWGCFDWLCDIHDICYPKKRERYPLEKWQVILNGLDRDMKNGCMFFDKNMMWNNNCLCRVYTIKNNNNNLF